MVEGASVVVVVAVVVVVVSRVVVVVVVVVVVDLHFVGHLPLTLVSAVHSSHGAHTLAALQKLLESQLKCLPHAPVAVVVGAAVVVVASVVVVSTVVVAAVVVVVVVVVVRHFLGHLPLKLVSALQPSQAAHILFELQKLFESQL